jgi:hypothetical protein
MTTTTTLPTIHMNGTSRKSLEEDYAAAAHALEEFIDRWGEIEFNARDYYVVDGAWPKALAEREAMSAKVRDIRDYLQSIREHLDA